MKTSISIPQRFLSQITEYVTKLEQQELHQAQRIENLRKGREFWDQGIPYIQARIKIDGDDSFKWDQLVYQEIVMYAQLNKKVTRKDYDFMCERRKFIPEQRQFLLDALRYMGLDGTV